MLTKEERALLENVLTSLDRLFDRNATVTDVRLLIVATNAAVRRKDLVEVFGNAIGPLNEIVRSTLSPDQKRSAALVEANALRTFIAQELQRDESENPKRRHRST